VDTIAMSVTVSLKYLLPDTKLKEKSSKLEYKGWYEKVLNYLMCTQLIDTIEIQLDEAEIKSSRLSASPIKTRSSVRQDTEDKSVAVDKLVGFKARAMLAYSVIISVLDDELINQFSTVERGNAFQLMSAIKRKYNTINLFTKINARREFNLIKMDRSESMTQYASRIKCAAHELELVDSSVKVGELELVSRFIDGLPGEFNDLVVSITSRMEDISYDEFVEIFESKELLDDKRSSRNNNTAKRSGNSAYETVNHVRHSNYKCYSCGEVGHIKARCPLKEMDGNEDKETYIW
jgi:hypothetical protein